MVDFWTKRVESVAAGESPSGRRRDAEKALDAWIGRQSDALRDFETVMPPAPMELARSSEDVRKLLTFLTARELGLVRDLVSRAEERMASGVMPEDEPEHNVYARFLATEERQGLPRPIVLDGVREHRETLEITLASPALTDGPEELAAKPVNPWQEDDRRRINEAIADGFFDPRSNGRGW